VTYSDHGIDEVFTNTSITVSTERTVDLSSRYKSIAKLMLM